MNPFAPSLFSMTAACLPCCSTVVGECPCALLIPPFADPYADYETAEAAITDFSADCYGFIDVLDEDVANLISFSFDNSTTNEFIISGEGAGVGGDDGSQIAMYSAFTALAGSELSMSWILAADPVCEREETIETYMAFGAGGTVTVVKSGFDTTIDMGGNWELTSNATPSSTGTVTFTASIPTPSVIGGSNPESIIDYYISVNGTELRDGDTIDVDVSTLYCCGSQEGPGKGYVRAFVEMSTTGPEQLTGDNAVTSTENCLNQRDGGCRGNLLTVTIYYCSETGEGDYSIGWNAVFGTEYEDGETSDVFTIPEDGNYIIEINALGDYDSTSVSCDFTVACDDAMVPNPVIALWDDSGTTRQLEACPRMLIPPLTESTGEWYADCASASDAIDTYVIDCIGYCTFGIYQGSAPGDYVFSAYGTTSLNWTAAVLQDPGEDPIDFSDAGVFYGSINAEAGDTLSFSFSGSPTDSELCIYDNAAEFIECISSGSSSPLPYTGKYIVSLNAIWETQVQSMSAQVTSSGTMSVNEVQALYDVGLTCPARLECGDSCP